MIYHPYKAQLSNSKQHSLCWSINVLALLYSYRWCLPYNGHGNSFKYWPWPSCQECSLGIEATCTHSFKQRQLGCHWGENVIFIWGPHVWNRCNMRGAFWSISDSTVCPSYIRHRREPWIHQVCSELFCFPSIWLLDLADLPRHSPSIAVCMIGLGTGKPLCWAWWKKKGDSCVRVSSGAAVPPMMEIHFTTFPSPACLLCKQQNTLNQFFRQTYQTRKHSRPLTVGSMNYWGYKEGFNYWNPLATWKMSFPSFQMVKNSSINS